MKKFGKLILILLALVLIFLLAQSLTSLNQIILIAIFGIILLMVLVRPDKWFEGGGRHSGDGRPG